MFQSQVLLVSKWLSYDVLGASCIPQTHHHHNGCNVTCATYSIQYTFSGSPCDGLSASHDAPQDWLSYDDLSRELHKRIWWSKFSLPIYIIGGSFSEFSPSINQ